MEVIDKRQVPVYELKCSECQSIIRYKASEVSCCHITCPVCGVRNWASTAFPVAIETEKYDDMRQCSACGTAYFVHEQIQKCCPVCGCTSYEVSE